MSLPPGSRYSCWERGCVAPEAKAGGHGASHTTPPGQVQCQGSDSGGRPEGLKAAFVTSPGHLGTAPGWGGAGIEQAFPRSPGPAGPLTGSGIRGVGRSADGRPLCLPARCFLLSEMEKEEKEKLWYYSQLQGLAKRLDELPHVETVRGAGGARDGQQGARSARRPPHRGRAPLPAVLGADGPAPAAAGVRGAAHPLVDGGAFRHLGRDGAACAGGRPDGACVGRRAQGAGREQSGVSRPRVFFPRRSAPRAWSRSTSSCWRRRTGCSTPSRRCAQGGAGRGQGASLGLLCAGAA